MAAPTINTITPAIVKVGTAQEAIQIIGSGFASACTVSFNGANVSGYNYVDTTEIDATLPGTDLATAGSFLIAVHCAATASNSLVFKVTDTGINGVNLSLGIGTMIVGKGTDYKINSTANIIEANVIGRATPQIMAGAGFRLPIPNFPGLTRKDPWHIFVNLKFAPGSTQAIDGFVFGLSYHVASHLAVLAGVGMTPYSVPSLGFRNAAINAVSQNPSLYPGFTAAGLVADGPAAFDGFPLLKQPLPTGSSPTTNANLYAGDPLETQYKGGLVIGISIPFTVGALLGYK